MTTYKVIEYRLARMKIAGLGRCLGYDLSGPAPTVISTGLSWSDADKIALSRGGNRTANFDRTAMYETSDGRCIDVTMEER